MNLSQRGFSLIEVIVTMGIFSILAMVLGQVITSNARTVSRLEFRNEVLEFDSEISLVLLNQSQCESSFKNGTEEAVYTTGQSNVTHVEVGGNVFIQLEATPRGYKTFDIIGINLVPSGISPTSGTYVDSNGVTYSGQNNTVSMELTLRSKFDSSNVKVVRKSLRLFTDSNNQIKTCNVRAKVEKIRAMAHRYFPAINRHYCIENVPLRYYQANSCPDSNQDGLCDDNENLTVSAHPLVTTTAGWGNLRWENNFPSRNEAYWGPAPLTGNEGRCPVQIDYNESNENPNQIFRLRTVTTPFAVNGGGAAEGVGCNVENGWRLAACTVSASGSAGGDADMTSGEYCVTHGHVWPHVSLARWKAWWNRISHIAIICEKIVEN